jgi:hypothetical protein
MPLSSFHLDLGCSGTGLTAGVAARGIVVVWPGGIAPRLPQIPALQRGLDNKSAVERIAMHYAYLPIILTCRE